jgi:hypothetical protein
MKFKQIFGIVLLGALVYGLWAKMNNGMSTFQVKDNMLTLFIALIFGTLLVLGIRQILRS